MRTSAPRARRRDFGTYRARILAAARRLVAERGPETLTVSAVARSAGVNRTTAYQHFGTRGALVGAVMEAIADEFTQMLTQPMPLGDRINQMTRFYTEHPEIGRLALYNLLAENPLPRAGWDRFMEEMRRLAGSPRSQEGVDGEMLGHILMTIAVVWPLQARALYDEKEIVPAAERLAREVKRLFLYGVLRPEKWPELVQSVAHGESESG